MRILIGVLGALFILMSSLTPLKLSSCRVVSRAAFA